MRKKLTVIVRLVVNVIGLVTTNIVTIFIVDYRFSLIWLCDLVFGGDFVVYDLWCSMFERIWCK